MAVGAPVAVAGAACCGWAKSRQAGFANGPSRSKYQKNISGPVDQAKRLEVQKLLKLSKFYIGFFCNLCNSNRLACSIGPGNFFGNFYERLGPLTAPACGHWAHPARPAGLPSGRLRASWRARMSMCQTADYDSFAIFVVQTARSGRSGRICVCKFL